MCSPAPAAMLKSEGRGKPVPPDACYGDLSAIGPDP
jgi:hypothetical protein